MSKKMTRDEWARSLITRMASGHTNGNYLREAKDWLAGKDPPTVDDWKPTAKEKFKKVK